MAELQVPRQRGAVLRPAPREPESGGFAVAIAHRLAQCWHGLLQGTDPNLAGHNFEAYYFDGPHR
jgi:hypothetical protein